MTPGEAADQLEYVKKILDMIAEDYDVHVDHEPLDMAINILRNMEDDGR